MDDTDRRYSALTQEDMRKLQVIQNQTLRLKTGIYELNTPTTELLEASGDLSVQQLGAFHTVLNVFKITSSGHPKYLAEKLVLRRAVQGQAFPLRRLNTIQAHSGLTLARSGFVYRGAQLWNQLPALMRQETRLAVFKTQLRKWIIRNVPAKPP